MNLIRLPPQTYAIITTDSRRTDTAISKTMGCAYTYVHTPYIKYGWVCVYPFITNLSLWPGTHRRVPPARAVRGSGGAPRARALPGMQRARGWQEDGGAAGGVREGGGLRPHPAPGGASGSGARRRGSGHGRDGVPPWGGGERGWAGGRGARRAGGAPPPPAAGLGVRGSGGGGGGGPGWAGQGRERGAGSGARSAAGPRCCPSAPGPGWGRGAPGAAAAPAPAPERPRSRLGARPGPVRQPGQSGSEQ